MNHAKILRTVALPLIVMLGICIVLVVAAPLTRFDKTPELESTTAQSAVPSNSAIGGTSPADVAQPAQPASPESDAHFERTSSDAEELELDGSGETAPSRDQPQAARTTDSVSLDARSFDLVWATVGDHLQDHVGSRAGFRTERPSMTTQVVSLEQPIPDRALDATAALSDEVAGAATPASGEPIQSAAATTVGPEAENGRRVETVEIRNPPENGYPVAFVINGSIVNLPPGQSHTSAQWPSSVGFDRGGGKGPVRKSLARGQYEFRLTQDGWTLESL